MAADAAALALGLRAGVTVAFAQASVPSLAILDADPEADAAALDRLAVWALRYTPIVAADPPDGLVLDIAGCAPLFGGEAELIDDLRGRLARAGIAAHLGVADSWAAAWGLARFASDTVAAQGVGLDAVSGLPVAALRLDHSMARALRLLGFESVGDLAAAPRASLTLRFGATLTGRLDAAAGRAFDAIEPVLAPSIPYASLCFAEPLGHAGGLMLALRELAARLCAALEAQGRGARRLDLRFRRVDNEVRALRVGASRATRDPAHIVRLFGDKLDTVDPGFGIESAVLAATRVEALGACQLDSHAIEGEVEPDLAVLVDRIAGRIGERRVYRLTPAESDMPERGVAVVGALAAPTGRAWADGPRPQRLFDPPRPVEVVALLPDHPPAAYTWEGRRRRVAAADGPESVAGEWWVEDAERFLQRDYFRCEDEDGQRVWLFRASGPETTRWFIQGVFA